MILIYRKHAATPLAAKDSLDLNWHFHTQCPHWPEINFVQARFFQPKERLCDDCVTSNSMPGKQQSRTSGFTIDNRLSQVSSHTHADAGVPRPSPARIHWPLQLAASLVVHFHKALQKTRR